MIVNIRENKRIISSFTILLNDNNYLTKYPNKNGCYTIIESCITDECSICCENYQLNDKIKKWAKCNHIYHEKCYNSLRHEHNIKTCPMCRTELKEVKYKERQKCLFLDDDKKEKETKYNDVSSTYIDEDNNLNIRYKVFCTEHNLSYDEFNLFSRELKNISIIRYFELISLISNDRMSEAIELIKSLLNRYIVNIKTIIKNFQQFSTLNIFNVDYSEYKYFQIDELIKKIIDDGLLLIINAPKKEFINVLKNNDVFEFWFSLNSLNKRKKFFQDNLSRKFGEKYRKLFNASNIHEFMILAI
jgi:hypothetical protein